MTISANKRIITYKRKKISGGVAKYMIEFDFSMSSVMIGISKIHFLPNGSISDYDNVLRQFSTHSLVINAIPLIDDDLIVIGNFLKETNQK